MTKNPLLMTKNIIFSFFLLSLFVLNFLALDDITTGSESNFMLEYLILFVSMPVFGYLLGNLWLFLAKVTKMKIMRLVKHGSYHVHHDMAAVCMIIASFVVSPAWLKIVVGGLGVGIFVHHMTTEGIVLISRD